MIYYTTMLRGLDNDLFLILIGMVRGGFYIPLPWYRRDFYNIVRGFKYLDSARPSYTSCNTGRIKLGHGLAIPPHNNIIHIIN